VLMPIYAGAGAGVVANDAPSVQSP
jgi:hypothetical protein